LSAQTGIASVPPPLPSVRGVARLRHGFSRLLADPNPVWMRELKAAARLQRTPVVLAVITGMMTLLVCSVGGIASIDAEPAKVGVWLYHTFFSLAFTLVAWMGPAMAATGIAAERSGGTWEALELTGLGAPAIARGKFLGALTYVSMYLVMLAPVGALPFLFGGVTALEVVLAFVVLGACAVLSVTFGLAMSSKFSSPALAILVTLLVSIPCSLAAYGGLGVGLSFAANGLWHGVAGGAPVWLPTAYVRADFGVEYVTLLILLPLVLVALPAWLFHEITVANMAAPTDDRSTRLRIWTLVAGPFMTATTVACGVALDDASWFVTGEIALVGTYLFVGFLFAGEPLGPSRRVEARWQREQVGAGRRFLGPGVMRACSLLLLLVLGSFAALLAAAAVTLRTSSDRDGVLALGGYAAAFLIFVTGFAAWTRARSRASGVPRVLLLGALFLAVVGPWIAMAIAGIFETSERALLVAAPSPLYAFHLRKVISSGTTDARVAVLAGSVAAASWALIGLGLLALAGSRVERRLSEERALRAGLEAPSGGAG
jgi:hypothetical protein